MNADTVLYRIKADMQKLSAGWAVDKHGVLTPPVKSKRTRVVTNRVPVYELCRTTSQNRAVYC